jgi:hypothetical protein
LADTSIGNHQIGQADLVHEVFSRCIQGGGVGDIERVDPAMPGQARRQSGQCVAAPRDQPQHGIRLGVLACQRCADAVGCAGDENPPGGLIRQGGAPTGFTWFF